jgi:hypothetical protein
MLLTARLLLPTEDEDDDSSSDKRVGRSFSGFEPSFSSSSSSSPLKISSLVLIIDETLGLILCLSIDLAKMVHIQVWQSQVIMVDA